MKCSPAFGSVLKRGLKFVREWRERRKRDRRNRNEREDRKIS